MLSGETESGSDEAWEDPWHSSSIISISPEGGEELEPWVCVRSWRSGALLSEGSSLFPRGVAGFPMYEARGAGAPFPKEA